MPPRTTSSLLTIPGLGVVPTANDTAVEEGQSAPGSSAKALALLQGDNLASLTIPPNAAKLPAKEVAGLLRVQPLALSRIKRATTIPALRKIASRDKLHPALTGVYLDVKKKCCVATNGHMLVVLPDSTLTGENRTVSIENGSVIDDRYPDYENVIPIQRTLVADVNELEALRCHVAGLLRASSFVSFNDTAADIRAEIKVGKRYHYYSCHFLLLVLEALMATGTTAVRLEFDSEKINRALLIRDQADEQKLAILMPVAIDLVEGSAAGSRAQRLPFCPVLNLNPAGAEAEKPAKAPKAAKSTAPKEMLFVVGGFAKVRPTPVNALHIDPQQKRWAGHTGEIVAVKYQAATEKRFEGYTVSLKFGEKVVPDWSDWQIEKISEAAARKAKSKAVYYQPTKELLESIGFSPWVDSEKMASFQYAHSVNGPWVRIGLYTKDATVRIESVGNDAYQTVYCDGVVRNEQEFRQKLALIPWKKFPAYEAGDAVSLDYGGVKVYGQIQPYTGGLPARIKKGIAEVYVASLNRDLDLPVAQLSLEHRFKDKPAHRDMLPSGYDKPAAAPKAAKAPKAARTAKPAPAPLDYFNAKGKAVTDLTGKIDPEKLYYVQPGGEYVQGGDRRSPGYVKPPKTKKVKAPKAAKAPKAKKIAPVDTRDEVPQLSGEVLLMQAFLKMEGKPASIDQVRALHRRMEKDFTKHKVRSTSKHADVLRGIAGTVAALYTKMTDNKIGTIAKLEFKSADTKQLADKAKVVVGSVRVGTATTLLSAFVNMQGTVPTEKAVAQLRTKLENEFEEHPGGDFALAVGAAAAVLKDWRAGKSVRITKQQLSGLSGLMDLGCPDTPPGKACGCSAAPKKARR